MRKTTIINYMKIIIISNYYPPYYKGGYELVCNYITDYLHSSGHDTYILTGRYGVDSAENGLPGTIEVNRPYRLLDYIDYKRASIFNKHRVEKSNYRITAHFIKAIEPDLVYIWNQQALSIAPAVAAQRLGIKTLFHICDFWPSIYYKRGLFSRLKRALKRLIPFTVGGQIRFDRVIAPSAWMVPRISSEYRAGELYIIPHGTALIEEDLTAKQLSSPVKYMFAGRIEPAKGVDCAIRAFAQLKKEGRVGNFEFNIYGSGDESYLKELKELTAQEGVVDNIHFRGHTREIERHYRECQVLIMPTLAREVFGLVIIEAFNYGMAVIATDRYGPKEIIEGDDYGLLFRPGSVDELAEKIAQLDGSPELRLKLARNSRRKLRESYGAEREREGVKRVIEELI